MSNASFRPSVASGSNFADNAGMAQLLHEFRPAREADQKTSEIPKDDERARHHHHRHVLARMDERVAKRQGASEKVVPRHAHKHRPNAPISAAERDQRVARKRGNEKPRQKHGHSAARDQERHDLPHKDVERQDAELPHTRHHHHEKRGRHAVLEEERERVHPAAKERDHQRDDLRQRGEQSDHYKRFGVPVETPPLHDAPPSVNVPMRDAMWKPMSIELTFGW